MTDKLVFDGLSVAPAVIETIARIATETTEGVAVVGTGPDSGVASLLKAKNSGVEIIGEPDEGLHITVHVSAVYGTKLHELGRAIQQSIADALDVQLGLTTVAVDVYIDGLVFSEPA
ncbi:MAG: Asp23/Gls24 family envelope stress response protein [Actinomycetes bacterium]|jgi:uncharacterized alkaline shock family protein YloU|nr:Asp23/Gls24 family envelope stress response protein [Actinomycetes bacterium]